ncbi:Serine/threonine-protein phosphatase 4 regulatory subunit 1 [Geodia barretti]|uniref:Serine/threonine-protein phosphatase 4 regulatory subunit 1 n=1 Tax=Geodia barretti TaxID=519541 RepID=A0AA35WT70_GEOBA|nr:Serine/threonine-protein phosphatase 4 regulatory subunit 1 [Geodia barretti]
MAWGGGSSFSFGSVYRYLSSSIAAELKLDLSRVDQVITASNAEVDGGGGGGEGGGDMGGEDGGVDSFTDMYDNLLPLEKLERYFQSEDVLDREMAVRCIPEALEAATSHSEYQFILEISMTLANDHEPTIRMLILDTVAVLLEHHSRLCLTSDLENGMENKERLFDVPIRMVSDINQQVRRISQTCVVSLLEDDTKNKDVLINQLVPEMERCLSRDEHYDLRMDMSLLLSRLAPLLGREVLVRKFVPLFPSLGRDAMFHVRKAFAMGCRDICPVLGEDLTEQHILQPFCDLCHDDVWGVRKACADVFADVAIYCNLGTRHDRLTPTFLRLLQDDSRWVRRAAFEHLGSFIATFYVSLLGSEGEQSSINPFSDSILLDNSLLPAHEEDGIWVGEAEDDETPPITRSERGASDSGTRTGESGMGNVPWDKEEEEPFFLFMDAPISGGRKEGKERGGKDSAVEERDGGKRRRVWKKERF